MSFYLLGKLEYTCMFIIATMRCISCLRTTTKFQTLRRTNRYLTGISELYIDDVDGKSRKVAYIDTGKKTDTSQVKNAVPLVFLMGTAQTIPAYTANIQALSRKHRVLIFELRGQGSTELDSSFATSQQQVSDVHQVVQKLIGVNNPVHLAGYSFGGRVALAYAAHYPQSVSRLSVTGVPIARSATGRLIVRSWEEALSRNNIRECAWSLVLNGYSDEMLGKMEKKIGSSVDYIIAANKIERLYDLIRLSHEKDPNSPFAIHNCAPRIKCPTQVIAGQFDRIAGYDETVKLSQAIPNAELVVFETGHSVPFEKTSQWCRTVSDFFDQ